MRLLHRALALALLAVTSIAAVPNDPAPAKGANRWTDATPDGMIDAAKMRALGSETDGIAAIATILALSDRATYGHAERALMWIVMRAQTAEVRGEAQLGARMLAADEG